MDEIKNKIVPCVSFNSITSVGALGRRLFTDISPPDGSRLELFRSRSLVVLGAAITVCDSWGWWRGRVTCARC